MAQPLLERIVADFDIDEASWLTFDFKNFSRDKQLWDYQQTALQNAVRALWKYYQDFRDYTPDEKPKETNRERKNLLWSSYVDNGLIEDLDYRLDYKNVSLLDDYFPVTNDKLPFAKLINRMSFWMATGSGKTLVIVKLIHLLHGLINRKEIPDNDILVLAHRDELLDQFRDHVRQFNQSKYGLYIRLHDLREYSNVKRNNPDLFSGDELNVFTYRSDLFGFEQKEKQIDFRNYENGGRWFVLLDEAHKGDKQDSKRQHIYSVLARNGFLFNFSATFTDPRDVYTTVSNFNLAEFVSHGYGKQIAILKQQIKAFQRQAEDFSGDDKQKIVLQSLLALAYISRQSKTVREVDANLYHKPLLITLVNSVNTEDADLKLFFRELERIAKGDVNPDIFAAAKDELREELRTGIPMVFGGGPLFSKNGDFESLELDDLREEVFNSRSIGSIEVLRRPSDRKEIAFKMQNAVKPFALIKIGDITDWLKTDLQGYEINETFNDEGYFETINADSSDIKILMGSRTFYEGWDSNRPNVINFINIGTGTDARKFVLQSIGRGVRVEPLPGKRRRLANLSNTKQVTRKLADAVKRPAQLLETLLIFGTNREALETVIEELNKEKVERTDIIELERNPDLTLTPLLIPTFELGPHPIIRQQVPKRYEVNRTEMQSLKSYIDYVGDSTVLMLRHRTEPKDYQSLQKTMEKQAVFYEQSVDARRFGNLGLLWTNLIGYFNLIPQIHKSFTELTDEISHYKNIAVTIKDLGKISELKTKIERVKELGDGKARQEELLRLVKADKLSLDEFADKLQKVQKTALESEEFYHDGFLLKIKRFAAHYYIPLLIAESERISYIKRIVKVPSERDFLLKLAEYIDRSDNRFSEFDGWAFSRIDETVDSVTIPYIDKKKNSQRTFNPDFVFWFKKGKDYSIVFIDPKGSEHASSYMYKLDGYKELFLDGDKTRVFKYQGLNVRVSVFLYNQDRNVLGSELYPDFWIDNMKDVIDQVLAY